MRLIGCRLISKRDVQDEVVPAEWQGPAQWIRGGTVPIRPWMCGGIAYYKGLLPEWMAPERLVDLNPAVMKAGVEAAYTPT